MKYHILSKILIMIIALILIGVGILIWQNRKILEEETGIPPDWKTYRDEQNNYEFKYPPNWTAHPATVSFGSKVIFRDTDISIFEIWTGQNPDDLTAEEWWDEKDRQDETTYTKKDSFLINGVNILVYQANIEPKAEQYIFTKNLKIYHISTAADKKTIEQILSTFKFINEELKTTQSSKEKIIEITGKLNIIDNQKIELLSEDGNNYILQNHPVLVWVFDLSNIQKKDYSEFIKGTREVMENRANLWGVPKTLVRTAQFPTNTKLLIEPLIDPTNLAENFIDESRKSIAKVPLLEIRLEGKTTGLTGKHLMLSQLDIDSKTNKPIINLKFNKEGERLFEELLAKNIGKELSIYLDEVPIYSFKIQNSIPVITGDFTVDKAKQIVRYLNIGALPVPLYPISYQNNINMEELRKFGGKTIWVKGYLLEKEAIKKTIYIINFNVK